MLSDISELFIKVDKSTDSNAKLDSDVVGGALSRIFLKIGKLSVIFDGDISVFSGVIGVIIVEFGVFTSSDFGDTGDVVTAGISLVSDVVASGFSAGI